MLIFISDLHLRAGGRLNLSRSAQFKRFWQRIEQSRRDEVAQLCIVGDLFDLVRTPEWLNSSSRPYHAPSLGLALEIERIIEGTLEAEAAFLGALRQSVDDGALEVHFVQGNHDRLLDCAPKARAAIRKAMGMKGGEAPHQLGNVSKTEPSFLAYDAMGYLAFFPKADPLKREFEWWQGAAAARA